MALHLKLGHPPKAQLKVLFERVFFTLDLDKQLETLTGPELLGAGIIGNGLGVGDVLHGEVRQDLRSDVVGAGFVDLGDAGMTQSGKDLGFVFKAS